MSLPQAPVPAGPLWHRIAFTLLMAAAFTSWPYPAAAQVAGQNVNMVSGTEWPFGDPFKQRQNEPSVAVSTRNPLHLLAGRSMWTGGRARSTCAPSGGKRRKPVSSS